MSDLVDYSLLIVFVVCGIIQEAYDNPCATVLGALVTTVVGVMLCP